MLAVVTVLMPALPARWSGNKQVQVIIALGLTQWLAWGSTYYLVTVIAASVAADLGWSLASVVAGLSFGLVIAGLISPLIGDAIERHGGRPLLCTGSVILASGLVALALARSSIGYFGAWFVLGIGMAASLYDAAFAALGRIYGPDARGPIAALTLISGLVMTVTWPVSAFLTEALSWRGTCLVYAALHLAVGFPLLLFLLPARSSAPAGGSTRASTREWHIAVPRRRRILLWLLGTNVTLQIVIGSVLAVHLLSLLQGLHVTLGAAVLLGSLMGACQVGSRLVEVSFAQRVHPSAEGVAASALVFAGLALLPIGGSVLVAFAMVVYGLGNGVRTIVKGTLPLALFGSDGYARLIGRLGMPTLIAQAVGPALGALALTRYGPVRTMLLLALLALVNIVISYLLYLGSASGVPAEQR